MQLTTSPGLGQRAGLQPPQAWFEIVKLEALAAKYVATAVQAAGRLVVGLGDVQRERHARPRQARRRVRLAVGARPDALRRPGGRRARLRRVAHRGAARRPGRRALPDERRHDRPQRRRAVHDAHRRPRLRGERAARAARRSRARSSPPTPTCSRPSARSSPPGSAATARSTGRPSEAAKLTLGDARAIIAARLERDEVEARFRAPAPSPAAIADFLATYRDQQVRLVTTTRRRRPGSAAPRRAGSSRRSPRASSSPSPGPGKIDTADGTFDVTPAGPALPLGLLPHGAGGRGGPRGAQPPGAARRSTAAGCADAGEEAPRRPRPA